MKFTYAGVRLSIVLILTLCMVNHAWHLEPCLTDTTGTFLRIKKFGDGVITTNGTVVFTSRTGLSWNKVTIDCDRSGFRILSVASRNYEIAAVGNRPGHLNGILDNIGMVFSGDPTGLRCTNQDLSADQASRGLVDIASTPSLFGIPHFIVVSAHGVIFACVDPWAMTTCSTQTVSSYYSVFATAQKAVAVGFKGAASISVTPFDIWKPIPLDTTISLNAVKFFDNRFIAVGSNGAFLQVFDDSTYIVSTIGRSIWLADIAKGEMGYVIASYGGLPKNQSLIFKSKDGTAWEIVDTVPSPIRSIEFADSGRTLIAVGDAGGNQKGGIIYRSVDGITANLANRPTGFMTATRQNRKSHSFTVTGRRTEANKRYAGLLLDCSESGVPRIRAFTK